MAHFGLLSYKGSGHLNPLFALSQRLVERGHRVTVFQHSDMERKIRDHGLEFFPVDVDCALCSEAERHRSTSWFSETRSRMQRVDDAMHQWLRKYPDAIRTAGVDVLLIGEIALAGPTVAEMLHLPYILVSTGIPHHFGWTAPRSIRPQASLRERIRRYILEVSVLHMRGPLRLSLNRYRRGVGLAPLRTSRSSFPELAHITQWPQCLEARRRKLTRNFFYTGPFVQTTERPAVNFPWERLDGRPMVYASLGTTRKGNSAVFKRIAKACNDLDLQVVVTLGGNKSSMSLPNLPGNAIVVADAPQLELLKRATLVVTHAGPNTALETLMQGKPMLALPITLDQPAVAAALAHAGAAEVLSPQSCSTEHIRGALTKLLTNPSYRSAAETLQQKLLAYDGADEAAQIIESKLSEHREQSKSADLPLTPG